MMKRSTVVLLTHAALGGSAVLAAAALLGQATGAPQQDHGLPGQVVQLLGPGASGIAGALVVALYNKVAAYERRIQALELFAKNRPCARPPTGLPNPDEPLDGLTDVPDQCEQHAHRQRRGRQ